jgi:hypothetical protein
VVDKGPGFVSSWAGKSGTAQFKKSKAQQQKNRLVMRVLPFAFYGCRASASVADSISDSCSIRPVIAYHEPDGWRCAESL